MQDANGPASPVIEQPTHDDPLVGSKMQLRRLTDGHRGTAIRAVVLKSWRCAWCIAPLFRIDAICVRALAHR